MLSELEESLKRQVEDLQRERDALLHAGEVQPAVRFDVSEIHTTEENEGPLRSTDLFLEGRGIRLLINLLAGNGATYSLLVDDQDRQSGEIKAHAGEVPQSAEEQTRLRDALTAVDAIEFRNNLDNSGDLAERISRIGAELERERLGALPPVQTERTTK